MKNIIRRAEINRRFTQIVGEYIQEGYVINTETMRGSQGEEGKVDLTKGEGIIRVLMQEHSVGLGTYELVISVLKFTDWRDRWTLWNQEGEEVWSIKFYVLNKGKGIYTDDEDGVREALKLHRTRALRKGFDDRYDASKKNVLKIVRRHKGYGRVQESEIWSIRKNGEGYTVQFRGKKDIKIG